LEFLEEFDFTTLKVEVIFKKQYKNKSSLKIEIPSQVAPFGSGFFYFFVLLLVLVLGLVTVETRFLLLEFLDCGIGVLRFF
jgi:hypothetical protein